MHSSAPDDVPRGYHLSLYLSSPTPCTRIHPVNYRQILSELPVCLGSDTYVVLCLVLTHSVLALLVSRSCCVDHSLDLLHLSTLPCQTRGWGFKLPTKLYLAVVICNWESTLERSLASLRSQITCGGPPPDSEAQTRKAAILQITPKIWPPRLQRRGVLVQPKSAKPRPKCLLEACGRLMEASMSRQNSQHDVSEAFRVLPECLLGACWGIGGRRDGRSPPGSFLPSR